MWDRFEYLCQTKIETSRKQLEFFTQMLTMLAQVEQTYANNLATLSSNYAVQLKE